MKLLEGAEGEVVSDGESAVQKLNELFRIVLFVDDFATQIGLLLNHIILLHQINIDNY